MSLQKQVSDDKMMEKLTDAEVPKNHEKTKKGLYNCTFLRKAGKVSWRKHPFNRGCRESTHVNRRRIHFLGKRDP